jgi:hypothetical protein
MAHFAKLDENNLVTQVVVVDNKDILDEQNNESEDIGTQLCNNLLGGTWKQTSYNNNIRYNYAGVGFTYDSTRDAFYEPQPYPSWTLNEDTCQWDSPVPYPTVSEGSEEFYNWDEETIQWVLSDV